MNTTLFENCESKFNDSFQQKYKQNESYHELLLKAIGPALNKKSRILRFIPDAEMFIKKSK